MLNDLLISLQDFIRRVLHSRLFMLSMVFLCMFFGLVVKLFHLQIMDGEQYQRDYVQMTEKTVTTAGTRGNIYDVNGNLLAYNEPAYSVTIQDIGAYPKSSQMNGMLLELIHILNKHGYRISGKLELGLDESGEMIYTSTSENARKRFLRDYYGLKSIEDLDDSRGKYPSNISARELFQKRYDRYQLGQMKDEKGNPRLLTDDEAIQIVDVRYTLSLSAYKKYETITITSFIDEETVADILEHTDRLKGVDVEESTIRRYNDAIYFAPIIGYTGKVQEDQLEDLKSKNPAYELNDIVGRTGIEASMEAELQGGKGYKYLIVNNVGSVMQVVSESNPTTGNDVYLTIDRDLQIGIYHLIEQQLAGIITSKLINDEVNVDDYPDTTRMPISIYDVYYQLINNNVLSLNHMNSDEASETEKEIYRIFENEHERKRNQIQHELSSEHAAVMSDLPKDMRAYLVYVYSWLSDSSVGIVNREAIDASSEAYQAWKDDAISLRDYLYSGIAEGWIDTSKLEVNNKYSGADDIYESLIHFIMQNLEQDKKFSKRMFRYLIYDGIIRGRDLCIALMDQGVLPYDETEIYNLKVSPEDYAFRFMKDCISRIAITPAQLALDPCTGGAVITDVNTGKVKAMVTYPSYDNNRLSGTVDAAYYNQLQEDLSLPLYNNATQAKKAPGSTFKPIAAVAGLEEHVITPFEQIECKGLYDEVNPAIRCWIYPGRHNALDVRGGIQNSCNYFFNEVAHRLSTDENGIYSTDKGIDTIRRYASMFGLDRPSGIEVSETNPELTTEDPERSAMGQGTNSYSNVQLSRYVSILANRGTVYDLSLLDRMTDAEGRVTREFAPKVSGHVEVAGSTWNAVQEGMRAVISQGSAKAIFKDLEIDIAGKTGTAQESKNRANHAFFISYGPYVNPDIAVTVNIPYGYSSSNAAMVAKNIYRFYYGYLDLDQIRSRGASNVSNVKIGD